MDPNSTRENASKYNIAEIHNTYSLGYRDIPLLLKKYNVAKKTIDYGCGTGRSTRFLKSLGCDVIGVDTSREMLEKAIENKNECHYFLINSGSIPVLCNSYDLIASFFVFFSVSKRDVLLSIFNEAYRCLKLGGFFIFITGSEFLYNKDWVSYYTNYPENASLKSGDKARIFLKDLDIEFINYLWDKNDYQEIINKSGFKIREIHYPLAELSNNFQWVSEVQYPPYVVYVLQKKP